MTRSSTLPGRLAATAALVLCAGPLSARSDDSTLKGVVYVQSNVAAAPGNQILAYRRNDAGKLRPLTGSPFSTGGAGISPSFTLGPYDSDDEIIANPEKTLLYATNGGSDSIAAFRIDGQGGLTPIPGSPFASGGTDPVGLALSGDTMVVVHQDNDPGRPGRGTPNYTTLRVAEDGGLRPIRRAEYPVDFGANPTQALIPPGHPSVVFGCDFLGGTLRSFQIGENRRLVPVDVQALPPDEFGLSGAPAWPLGLWAHPRRPILYVGFVTINRMAVYRFDEHGRFRFLRTVPNSGHALCWIRSNKTGTRLYTSNTADPSISVYDTSDDPTEPVEIQRVPLKGRSNVYQITLDQAGEFFYAVTQRNSADLPASANALHVLKVLPNGMLQEVESSPTLLPVPANVRPQGVLAF